MTQNKYNKGDQVQIGKDWAKFIGYLSKDKTELNLAFNLCEVEKDGKRFVLSVELITDHRPAFDWGTVKEGMCFKHKEYGNLWWYMGAAYLCIEDGLLEIRHTFSAYEDYLIRHPEGDICEANESPEGDISSETVVAASNESTEV